MELYQWELHLRPESEKIKPTFPTPYATLYGTGKFTIQYQRIAGDWSSDYSTVSKLATGKLELEVTSDPPSAEPEPMPQDEKKKDLPMKGELKTEKVIKIGANLDAVDVENHMVTLTVAKKIVGKESRIVSSQLANIWVAKDAKVLIEGKAAKLADLRQKNVVSGCGWASLKTDSRSSKSK